MIVIAYIKEGNTELTPDAGSQLDNGVLFNNNRDSSASSLQPTSNPPDVIANCKRPVEPARSSLADQLISCFSVQQNVASLTSLKTSPNAVPVIDGLK